MAGQDVFKGALGWDDWIWWSGLGGLGLLLLMLVLCCVVCVQRAKRKGRAEALAAVQARERERQTQEQAQLRYAQAQQARYPAREASFKFSKPEPPQPTYNPYGHDDHAMRRNSYSSNAPVPKPKSSRSFQQPPGQQPMQQPPQQDPYHQQQQQPNRNDQPQQHYGAQPAQNYGGQQQAYGGQQYYSMPRREPQQQQQQQQYGYNVASPPPPRREFEELPQVAAYYGRKPQPQAEPTPSPQQRNSGPVMSQQYQRQQQINPNQPMIAQYRKVSGRSDVTPGGSFVYDAPAVHETPFVQVTTPRGSAASTASTNYSTAATPSTMPPPPPVAQGLNDRSSVASSSTSSIMKTGGTLRDRIDALRDSSAVLPATDSYARISVGSAASLNGSQVSYTSQHQQQQQPPAKAPLPPRRLEVVSGTVLSDASSTENEFVGTRYDNAFDEDAYATARSTHGMRRADSDLSIGVDDEPSRPSIPRDPKRRGGQRGRTTTGDSTGSIEF